MALVSVRGSDGSSLAFDGETVEITRKGGFGSMHRKGSKRIPVRSIAAVQFKEPGLTVGFIQFTIGADQQHGRRGGAATEAVRDENAVVFRKDSLDAFRQMREVIEMAMNTPPPALPAPSAAATSTADELLKLASLRDAGVLSQAEFDAAKARLLTPPHHKEAP